MALRLRLGFGDVEDEIASGDVDALMRAQRRNVLAAQGVTRGVQPPAHLIHVGEAPQKAATIMDTLTATERKFCRIYGITPQDFITERQRLAALDASEGRENERASDGALLSGAEQPAVVELSAADLKYCSITGCAPSEFLAMKRRMAAEDAQRAIAG